MSKFNFQELFFVIYFKLLAAIDFLKKNTSFVLFVVFLLLIIVLLLREIVITKKILSNLLHNISELKALLNDLNAKNLQNVLKNEQLQRVIDLTGKPFYEDPNHPFVLVILAGCVGVILLKIFGGN